MSLKATDVYFTLSNGVRIPALGLGTANLGDKIPFTKQAVIDAVRAGYRHIDTAWIYSTEAIIGEALKELFENKEIKREELFITTKVDPSLADDVEYSVKDSLKKLNIDYVDLLLQHWPTKKDKVLGEDGVIDREATKASTKGIEYNYVEFYQNVEKYHLANPTIVRSIGVSNYSNKFLKDLLTKAKVKPVVNQIELHPHLPQRDVVEFALENDILLTAYSPVGSRGAPNLEIPIVKELAKKYGTSVNSILTSYHILEHRSVIPKSTNTERIQDVTNLTLLTKEDLKALTEFGEKNPKRFIAPEFGKNLGFTFWT